MRISSQFKDFYDYVAHQYGGGDPSILYLRNRLAPLEFSGGSSYHSTITVSQNHIRSIPNNYHHIDNGYNFKWLAVCGKYYLLVQPINATALTPFRILSENEHADLFKKLTSSYRFWDHLDANYWIGDFQPELVDLSRKVNAPVFTFVSHRNSSDIIVDGEIPILADLDFQRLYSPEQLYQDISYFMGNQIKESPDTSPRTTMTDKERIVQHGFDIKQSFRHRK